jgi:hypothetical protein
VVLGVLATVGLLVFGVYAIVDGPPAQVEAVVYFTPEATVAQKDAVRAHCPTVGRAIQEPASSQQLATNRVYPLRYDLSDASTSDRARLFACVQGRPGVVGMSTVTQGEG